MSAIFVGALFAQSSIVYYEIRPGVLTFSQTQECSNGEEAAIVLDKSKAHPDNTPCRCQECEPDPRAGLLENKIGGQFGCNVESKENGQSIGVLAVVEADVLFQTKDFGVSNIGSIKERAEEEHGENREDSRWSDPSA